MGTLGPKDTTQILYAALNRETFTVEQLIKLTGLKKKVVEAALKRAKGAVERVETAETVKVAGRQPHYRLTSFFRRKIARECLAIERERLSNVLPYTPDLAERISVVFRAIEGSMELQQIGATIEAEWG